MFALTVFAGMLAAGIVIGVVRNRRAANTTPTTFQRTSLTKK